MEMMGLGEKRCLGRKWFRERMRLHG